MATSSGGVGRRTSRGKHSAPRAPRGSGATIPGTQRRPGQTHTRARGTIEARPPTRHTPPATKNYQKAAQFSSFRVPRSGIRDSYPIAKDGRHDRDIHSLRQCRAMLRPRTLVCLFSASLPYWRQRREECCTNPEALTSWTRLLPPARAQGFGTSCGSDRLSQGSPCPRFSGGDSRLPRRRMSPRSLPVSLLKANTTASGHETRRASSDPACNRWGKA